MIRSIPIDLSLAVTRAELAGIGTAVRQVFIAELPTGAAFALHEGPDGDALELAEGDSFEYDRCEPQVGGLYYTVPSGGSGTAVIWLVLGSGVVSRG